MTLDNNTIEKMIERSIKFEYLIFVKLCEENNKELIEKFNKMDGSNISTRCLIEGYITTSENVTQKGRDVLELVFGKEVSKKVDIIDYEALHKKLQAELKQLTGKNQKVLQGKYSFLQNSTDFKARLSKIVKKYKIEDAKRVENVLLAYIYKCYKANFEYCQILEYYLEKHNTSKFYSDYLDFEENKKEEKSNNSEMLI